MSADDAFVAVIQARAGQELNVILKPLSHPELGEILIEDSLFAIGRNEPPFSAYETELVAELSRRQARIFWDHGALYVADLGSKNGTLVNGAAVREKPCRLQDGDELRLGRELAYRVRIVPRATRAPPAGSLLSLTLTPERDDLGLQPIVITRFPFLISKTDEAFARYKDAYPHQVNYISRRHAHIFLKGDAPYVEDLGSTNGTFVGDTRLDEHAAAIEEGARLAFGGSHFAYKVSLQREPEGEPTQTQSNGLATAPEEPEVDADKTTFVAAADSFLDIFCTDSVPQQDEINEEAAPAHEESPPAGKRKRSRAGIFLHELGKAFAGGERAMARRALRWGIPVAALLAAGAIGLYLSGATERELKALVAEGQYAQAATVADDYLASHPDNAAFKALGTEALLKARLPEWLASVQGGDFDRATALLAQMQAGARHNAEAQGLLGELGWIAELAQFTASRGGTDAPIRIYADEARIKALLQRWNDDPKAHQKALTQIAALVPAFRDVHAEALTQLRRLESDESVYLAAMDRLNAGIATELAANRPEALDELLNEYADKYPRLAGLDALRQDLGHYIALDRAARAHRLGPLAALLEQAQFSTPPFQAQFRELAAKRLPPDEVLGQYRVAAQAWREGKTEQAFAGLRAISGPWSDAAASELAREQAVFEQFKALQQARGGKGYDERLLAFYASLEPREDVYFIKATEAEVGAHRDQALARARELVNRAQGLWRQYRNAGGIGGEQRLESEISGPFRAQARLLSEAQADVQQGLRIYQMFNAEGAAQAAKVRDEINGEAETQRRSLQDLNMALAPDLLKAKLALIGGESNEARKSP
jgi:pSer/pThr/pTyr-binding forkhead associated (FHA) protein